MAIETFEIDVDILDTVGDFPTVGDPDTLYMDNSTSSGEGSKDGNLYWWNGNSYQFAVGPRPKPTV